jgi:DNA-binding NarL/FixJ family response regulator
VLKNASKKEIFEAIESALSGERFFSRDISKIIVDGFVKRANDQAKGEAKAHPPTAQKLTDRETEVLQYIAQGYTNRQIANTLNLSFRTVNTHRANIMQKLDIHDTAGLVRHAITLGLVKAES